MIERRIPATGEMIPLIGLGTWQSFDVSPSSDLNPLQQVISQMSNSGGKLIDSSPMYGRSEEIIGMLTENTETDHFFYATKVWTQGKEEGIRQMENSFRKFRRSVIDLLQVHNLVDWKIHLKTLRQWKQEGRIRYIGITHYTDNMHNELAKIIKSEKIDFVQFNYSITDRNAEKVLLPTASDAGVATLINRPFGEGRLFNKVRGKEFPSWTNEYEIKSWSEFFLKFIISHPAVTCVIPATSNPAHAKDNFNAGLDPLPDQSTRTRMIELIEKL
jgi:diketogulonate reductase-like aldo/keto reductase